MPSRPLGMMIKNVKKPRHLSGFGIYPETENLVVLLLRQHDVRPLTITTCPRKWKWVVFSMPLCHQITPTTLRSKHDITWNFLPWQPLRPEHPCFWLCPIPIGQLSPAVKDPWNPRKGTRKTRSHILEAFSPYNLHNRENPEPGKQPCSQYPSVVEFVIFSCYGTLLFILSEVLKCGVCTTISSLPLEAHTLHPHSYDRHCDPSQTLLLSPNVSTLPQAAATGHGC